MMNSKNKEISLPQQRNRSLSGRRESPTVPGVLSSLSCVRLTTSQEVKAAIVAEEVGLELEGLPELAFVDCSFNMDMELVEQLKAENKIIEDPIADSNKVIESALKTPRAKRKAKTSPGIISSFVEDQEQGSRQVSPVVLRKPRSRKIPRKIKPSSSSASDSGGVPQSGESCVEGDKETVGTYSQSGNKRKKKLTKQV